MKKGAPVPQSLPGSLNLCVTVRLREMTQLEGCRGIWDLTQDLTVYDPGWKSTGLSVKRLGSNPVPLVLLSEARPLMSALSHLYLGRFANCFCLVQLTSFHQCLLPHQAPLWFQMPANVQAGSVYVATQ